MLLDPVRPRYPTATVAMAPAIVQPLGRRTSCMAASRRTTSRRKRSVCPRLLSANAAGTGKRTPPLYFPLCKGPKFQVFSGIHGYSRVATSSQRRATFTDIEPGLAALRREATAQGGVKAVCRPGAR